MVNSNNIIVLIKMNINIFHKIVDAKTKGCYNEIAMKYIGISKNQKKEVRTMRTIKLGELVIFIPGLNPTRAEKQSQDKERIYYDHSSFEVDYYHRYESIAPIRKATVENDLALNEGDIVMSNSLQLAAMVSKENVGKVLSLNFTKVKFNDRLDKRYFLFLFNSYNDVQRQKERELQGNGVIQRIPLKALGQMVIPVVPMEEQIKIGAIYAETSKLQSNINRYAELLVRYTNMILENQLKEGRTHE